MGTLNPKLILKFVFLIAVIIYLVTAESTRKQRKVTRKTKKPVNRTTEKVMNSTKSVKPKSYDEKFEDFKKKYNKHYQTPEEEEEARNNFIKAAKSNEAHNKRKNETFRQDIMPDSDKSYEWKVKNRMGAKRSVTRSAPKGGLPKSLSTRIGESLPENIDWTPWCSPVKDQHACGSCWAFSAISVLEYLVNVIRGNLTLLSEQNLIDCSFENGGCDGGWPTYAFEYIIENGIVTNRNYPYVAYQSECIASRFKPFLSINETFELEVNGDEEYLKYLVATYGPVVVVIWATDPFVKYKSGIYFEQNCPNDMKTHNHAIVVVGYGRDYSSILPMDYWIIRNSWGTSWGIGGYGKFARNFNLCGIGNYAMLPSSAYISKLKSQK